MELKQTQKDRIIWEAQQYLNRATQLVDTESNELIEKFRDMLLGLTQIDPNILSKENLLYHNSFAYFVSSSLGQIAQTIDFKHPFIQKIVEKPFDVKQMDRFYVISRLVAADPSHTFFKQLVSNGCDERELILKVYASFPLAARNENGVYQTTPIGGLVKDKLEDKSALFGLKKVPGLYKDLIDRLKRNNYSDFPRATTLAAYLHNINPTYVLNELEVFITKSGYHEIQINIPLIKYLLELDSEQYLNEIDRALESKSLSNENMYVVKALFHEVDKSRFHEDILRYGASYLQPLYGNQKRYFYDRSIQKGVRILDHYFGFLFDNYPEEFKTELEQFIESTAHFPPHVSAFMDEKLGEESIVYLSKAFQSKKEYLVGSSAEHILSLLKKYDCEAYFESILNYTVQFTGKKEKRIFCEYLASYDSNAQRGIDLLKGKKIQERIVGALLLSNIPEEKQANEIFDILNQAIDTESNDETRNVMLESVQEKRFSEELTKKQTIEMVALAEKRKKLNKWNYKWLEEDKLPSLYWKDGTKCEQNVTRFLLYRMKLCKGMQSDIEARELLRQIDKPKAEKLAEYFIQAFADSNSDTKLKYYLTLGGLLGNDKILNKLHSLFRSSIANKRSKMAEYVLGAIAMVGSNKALRVLELISRKYANKKPKLSGVAIQALDASANELGITKDQLADRIIPNFEFTGTFKEFDVSGETYRAYVNKEFKLIYVNENNKSRKSVPPGAAPEVKKEFKAIEKDIRDIVKTQKDRLQGYMVQGRRWKGDEWKEFLFNNPIMFVYVTQLIWIKIDPKSGEFHEVFYCDEDAEIFNFEDEEVEIADDDTLCILHPCYLSKENLQAWKDKVFEYDIKTIFPIVDRKIYSKLPEELESNRSLRFSNQDIPKGADFAGQQMVKKGYYKTTGDGGYLEFSKFISSPYIKVIPNIEGPAAWYQNNTASAKVHDIVFIGNNWKEKIKIKDVPDAFYSEVMADIDSLIQAQA